MRIQKQPNGWSCFPTALAICLDVPVASVIKNIGHDGSKILWPWLKSPFNVRAFHPTELANIAQMHNYSFTCFERKFALTSYDDSGNQSFDFDLDNVLYHHSGVLTGLSHNGMPHAVAWDHTTRKIYNPGGSIDELSSFTIRDFYLVKAYS